MEERINQALVQLESDLQSLQSAKEQVEKTVGASAELQKTVGEYVVSVKNLCVTLKTWENNLKTRESSLGQDVESSIAAIERTCSTLITAFNTNVNQATTTFQTKTETVLGNFISENNKLVEQVESLNGLWEKIEKATEDIQLLKDSLSQISKDLKESQDEQDEALNDIQQKVTNLPSQVHEKSLSVIQAISNSEKALVDSVNIAISKTDEINGKLTTEIGKLETGITEINSLCKSISTSIETFSKQSLSVLNSLKANEQNHFNAITKQHEEQEKRLNTEFDIVRKQNKLFSVIIIFLLVLIIGLLAFWK